MKVKVLVKIKILLDIKYYIKLNLKKYYFLKKIVLKLYKPKTRKDKR